MGQRVSMVTLGVSDVPQAKAFYENGLGWRASLLSSPALVLFRAGGLVICLQPAAELETDLGLGDDPGMPFQILPTQGLAEDSAPYVAGPRQPVRNGPGLSQSVKSPEEAVEILDRVEGLGARITRAVRETSWGGQAGTFLDPDGHAWSLIWHPAWFDNRGRPLFA